MRTGVARGCRCGRELRSAKPLGAFDLIPGDPLAHGVRTNARGGDEVPWQVVVEYAGDQFGSTRGGGSGILVDVYSVNSSGRRNISNGRSCDGSNYASTS